ncbi:hypothetical protein CSB20_00185 [bacterium DOLZORAL124_64_63]|nr:MAG: hypothetical protein CSB20_00185 [bacterium DOLZORAL124_64_63]
MPTRSKTFITLGILLVVGLHGLSALAFTAAPPPACTNAPGENNCTACHASFPLNSGSGTLGVAGIDGSYLPGESYDLVIELQDPDASSWGFEFTVIDDEGNAIGSLTSLDGTTQVASSGGRDYAMQTSAGAFNGVTGSVSWSVRWTAPDEGRGDAIIYMVGCAADGAAGAAGDYTYADSITWSESTVSSAPVAVAPVRLLPNYPNPFNPRTKIAFVLDEASPANLAIYSLDGRLVRQLENGLCGEGHHEYTWDGLDAKGRAMPTGTYIYRLRAGEVSRARTMVLVR